MPAAALPHDEQARLLALQQYEILDAEPHEAFDGITRLAQQLCAMPVALVSLTADSRQWFMSRVGVTLAEIPREWAPCAHVVVERRNIVCPDMRLDVRFADNPLVTGPPHFRFYAGMALVTPGGAILGTLAVMDTVPRELTALQTEGLTLLARQIVDALELRMAYRDLSKLRAREKLVEQRLRVERMDEAQRLAAELHDGVGQDLVGVSLLLDAFLRTPAAQIDAVREPIGDVTALLRASIARCRQVSQAYGGFLVKREGVVGALDCFARSLANPALRIEVGGAKIPRHCIDETAAYHLFGIGHEAITNACRHSRGTVAQVRCVHGMGSIHLSIEDDGQGLAESQAAARGSGLAVMEYRAQIIGAKIRYESASGGGLRIVCELPCRSQACRASGVP
jgi:signal transduction histidine kinase